MDSQLLVGAFVTVAVLAVSLLVISSLWKKKPQQPPPKAASDEKAAVITYPEPSEYVKQMMADLPAGTVILPKEVAAFQLALKRYFSIENRDLSPACIVKPRTAEELSIAVKHLSREHAVRQAETSPKEGAHVALFAIRAGGANPAMGLANAVDGVVLDLSLFDEVTPAEDGKSVVVGAGNPWNRVYHELEKRGLAVVGGRSTPVGVGGSILGGGTSYYSNEYGFMCSNVLNYEVVLADGRIVNASETENADLWRALKGGTNNFGVVTRFTLRSFPAGPIWIGQFVGFGWSAKSELKAFYDYGVQSSTEAGFDEHAATPIMSMNYMPDKGMTFFFNQMAYSRPPPAGSNKWPEHWAKSPFAKLWGFKYESMTLKLSKAVEDLGSMSKNDHRHSYCTTTFKNDLPTLMEAKRIWESEIPSIKHIPNAFFCIHHQILNPRWIHKGQPNVMGLEGVEDPLVLFSFSADWTDPQHDQDMRRATQKVIEGVEAMSKAKGTHHPYRFLNYCDSWQRPFESYGKENMDYMRDVSRRYDPEGLFQTGCLGGFKLGFEKE